MTNKSYFKSLKGKSLHVGDFTLFVVPSLVPSSEFLSESDIEFQCSEILYRGVHCNLSFHVSLTKRSIITFFSYSPFSVCKFSPYELHEWSPAIFFPWTNYLHWLKYLRVALETFVESNPKILQSC